MKTIHMLVAIALLASASPALAGVDAPGHVWLDIQVEDLPAKPVSSQAYLSTDASDFGKQGVLIWTSFPLDHPDGERNATLLLDLAIAGARLGEDHPLGDSGIRVEYWEQQGDAMVFEGRPVDTRVHLVGYSQSDSDGAAVEGRFELVLADVHGLAHESRALLSGAFITNPGPRGGVNAGGSVFADDSVDVETGCAHNDAEVESGCDGDTWEDDDYEDTGCGGDTWEDDDYDDTGCEGDTWEDDDYDDSGCEGDDWEDDDYDDSGCEGDDWEDDSWDDDSDMACAVAPVRRRADPLRGLTRFLPELTGLAFIAWLRRRRR